LSKIFEALNRAQGELPELVRPVLTEEGSVAPGAAAVEASQTAAVEPEPATAPTAAEARPKVSGGQTRTQRFRIPAPSPLLPFGEGDWQASEQYRILRTKVLQHPGQPRMIVISSPGPGDGKTVTAVNLAAAISLNSEGKVLLLDADFRRSSIHALLGLPEAPGLADVLTGTCALEDALVRSEELSNLYVLGAGEPQCNPAELLDSSRWRVLLPKLRSLFRNVIVDCPPVAAVTDYDLIQTNCDGVLLVMRPDHTRRPLCFKALASVPKEKLIGVVLNSVPKWFAGNSAPSYYYYSGNQRPHALHLSAPPAAAGAPDVSDGNEGVRID
jgi:capsular exopolysaccharide synthesis family protein